MTQKVSTPRRRQRASGSERQRRYRLKHEFCSIDVSRETAELVRHIRAMTGKNTDQAIAAAARHFLDLRALNEHKPAPAAPQRPKSTTRAKAIRPAAAANAIVRSPGDASEERLRRNAATTAVAPKPKKPAAFVKDQLMFDV